MSETRWTPGPWGLAVAIDIWIKAGPVHVATIPRAGDGDWSPHNAHLIASAPDLYQALKDLIEECESAFDGIDGTGPSTFYQQIERAEKALRKARGEDQ